MLERADNRGQMVGALPAAVISDRYGRRTAMFTGAWCIITGTIVCATAHAMAQFVVGRFILGLGITVMLVAAPAYSMEIAPPQWRGRCTGLLNCGWFAGSIPAAAVTYATNYIKSDMSWRIPVILQAFTCVIVIATVYLIPESPRWQMANGKEEEAFAFLVKYHGGGNPNSKLVVLQMEEFKDQISTSGSDKTWWDYRPLFATRNARWRTLQVTLMSVSGQFSGNGLGYFNTIIYRKIGVTSVVMQLAFNLVYAVVSAIGALIGACLSDRMPRRIPLVFGTLVCAGWLAINAGLQTKIAQQGENINAAVGRGALATYFMFTFTFTFCYAPLQAVVPVEALENMMRAKGLGFGSVISGSMGFLNQFAGPIALEKINYGYIWFFAAWDVVEAGLWWLFCVEGQGRTLEELAWVYDQPNPVKASIGLTKNHHVEARRDVDEL